MTSVYGNGTNSTSGANTILHFYDKAGIKAANRVNVYGQFATKKYQPKKRGKTYKISKFLHMYDRNQITDPEFGSKGFLTGRDLNTVRTQLLATDGTGASLTEGVGATNERKLEKITFSTSFARFGEMLPYTDEVELFSEDAIQVRYREELGALANSRYEDLLQIDMLNTPTQMFAGTATTDAGMANGIADDGSEDVKWRVSYNLIRKGIRRLVRNRAQKNTSIVEGSTKIGTKPVAKAFYAIIGSDVKGDLENLTRGSGAETEYVYVPFHKYGNPKTAAQGEVGAMHEARFIESESALANIGGGAAVGDNYVGDLANNGSNFDVHYILFPSQDAIATVGLRGMNRIKFNAKAPSDASLNNPYATKGFFSYNFFYASILLKPEAVLRMSVCVSK